ncbi:MAG: MOSC domain-containing protein [Myxococcales bacterium]|nr:MOSC domain-containing protein [Myxococcales bacterium]
MRIVSVQAGPVETFTPSDGQPLESAIRKRDRVGPVAVDRDGIACDAVFETHVHGGPERALHVFDRASYRHFEALAGRPLPVPTFGENLTVEGYDEFEARVGDRLRAGTALLEVSQPTERCAKPGRHAGEPRLLKWILASDRCGFYLRVLEPGSLAAGDALGLLERGPEQATIARLAALMTRGLEDAEGVRAAHAIPALADEWKQRLEVLRERRRHRTA